MTSDDHVLFEVTKAFFAATFEKLASAPRHAKNLILRPSDRKRLEKILAELWALSPDLATVERTITEIQGRGYTGADLDLVKQRMDAVRGEKEKARGARKAVGKKPKFKRSHGGATRKPAVKARKKPAVKRTVKSHKRGSTYKSSYRGGRARGR